MQSKKNLEFHKKKQVLFVAAQSLKPSYIYPISNVSRNSQRLSFIFAYPYYSSNATTVFISMQRSYRKGKNQQIILTIISRNNFTNIGDQLVLRDYMKQLSFLQSISNNRKRQSIYSYSGKPLIPKKAYQKKLKFLRYCNPRIYTYPHQDDQLDAARYYEICLQKEIQPQKNCIKLVGFFCSKQKYFSAKGILIQHMKTPGISMQYREVFNNLKSSLDRQTVYGLIGLVDCGFSINSQK